MGQDDDFSGTYRPRVHWFWRRVLPAAALGYFIIGVAAYLIDGQIELVCFALPPLWAAQWYVMERAPRTRVQPDGLHVRQMLRWRHVPWRNVLYVKELGRWDLQPSTMLVITSHGELRLPGLAPSQGDALMMYASAHRSGTEEPRG